MTQKELWAKVPEQYKRMISVMNPSHDEAAAEYQKLADEFIEKGYTGEQYSTTITHIIATDEDGELTLATVFVINATLVLRPAYAEVFHERDRLRLRGEGI